LRTVANQERSGNRRGLRGFLGAVLAVLVLGAGADKVYEAVEGESAVFRGVDIAQEHIRRIDPAPLADFAIRTLRPVVEYDVRATARSVTRQSAGLVLKAVSLDNNLYKSAYRTMTGIKDEGFRTCTPSELEETYVGLNGRSRVNPEFVSTRPAISFFNRVVSRFIAADNSKTGANLEGSPPQLDAIRYSVYDGTVDYEGHTQFDRAEKILCIDTSHPDDAGPVHYAFTGEALAVVKGLQAVGFHEADDPFHQPELSPVEITVG